MSIHRNENEEVLFEEEEKTRQPGTRSEAEWEDSSTHLPSLTLSFAHEPFTIHLPIETIPIMTMKQRILTKWKKRKNQARWTGEEGRMTDEK